MTVVHSWTDDGERYRIVRTAGGAQLESLEDLDGDTWVDVTDEAGAELLAEFLRVLVGREVAALVRDAAYQLRAQEFVDHWNKCNPAGTDVLVIERNGTETITRTSSAAWVVNDSVPVVELADRPKSLRVDLYRVRALSPEEREALS